MNFQIDLVFPYVNNFDTVWQKTYEKYCEEHNLNKMINAMNKERFRANPYLPFVFRGIEKFMPFIRKVFLIVSNIEQVPEWVNQEIVQVVLHKDFIPEQYLPTYNSTTIEMFLPEIKGLSDYFIYANDDMYVINSTTPEDYFTDDGYPKLNLIRHGQNRVNSQYWEVCYKLYTDISNKLGINPLETGEFVTPGHNYSPINKQQALQVKELLGDLIPNSITNFRTNYNYNQYIYAIYPYLTGKYEPSTRTARYIAMNKQKANIVASTISGGANKELILNDVEDTDLVYWKRNATIVKEAFLKKLPNKSIYEKRDVFL